ncbi:MAG TPA: short-chain dehydrogenase, partial [Cytophagales bacterium]|nr:short-chain dehydrogenase [Cytophagales bacterium]
VSGLSGSQKMMMGMLPFMPKKRLMKMVRQMQEVTN